MGKKNLFELENLELSLGRVIESRESFLVEILKEIIRVVFFRFSFSIRN